MKTSAGRPTVGRTTMLGLNIAKALDFTSWFRVKPMTMAAAPTKQTFVSAKSSTSTTSQPHERPQLNPWEPLDDCLQSNGAMEPFHTMFDQGLLDAGLAVPKSEGTSISTEPLQIPFASDSRTSHFKTTTQTSVPADPHHRIDGSTALVSEHASAITISPSYLSDKTEIAPFSTLFPSHLLSDRIDSTPDTNSDALTVLGTLPLPHLGANSHILQLPEVLGNHFTSDQAYGIGSQKAGVHSPGTSGRASPQPSTTSSDNTSILPDTLSSSRRSSWASSISTYHEDGDSDQSSTGCAKSTVESNQNTEKIELILEYQHYCELIDLGDAQNCRDRNFSAQKPDQEEHQELASAEPNTQVAGVLKIEGSGGMASDYPTEPAMQAETDQFEEDVQSETASDLDGESKIAVPPTPGEAAAWAHSYCDADPESAKLKILTDERGREYVLYHDCFHCVPIELAPEFMHVIDEEDDGYGSATETSEAARDGTKLGTIPEEEDEG